MDYQTPQGKFLVRTLISYNFVLCIILCLTAPAAETSNNLSSWVGEELNVSDRPELTSAKVVVSGGVTIISSILYYLKT